MKKLIAGVLSVVYSLGFLQGLANCFPFLQPTYEDLPFLTVQGSDVVDPQGNLVFLRGANVGGLGVIEQWMNGFTHSWAPVDDDGVIYSDIPEAKDHYTTSQVFIERFGVEGAQDLWKEYQRNWFNEEDFKNCADMGMTTLRFPFTYMNVDFAAIEGWEYAGKSYDFTILDEFVDMAAKYGMYTILDLHGAYGSQNGKDHSGQDLPDGNDFYENEEMKALTTKLWKEVAKHFKDNPNVAAYDILNEPAETTLAGNQTTSKKHWDYFDELYDAIRSVDNKHIVIIESCWEGNNLPHPSTYNWTNCMYSFHHYTSTSNYNDHTGSWNSKLDNIHSQNFGVPLYMGEFTCYETEESWDYTLDLMNANGWHWTSWTYKVNATRTMAWGIYNIQVRSSDKVNAHIDEYDTIVEKFKKLNTKTYATPYTFDSGATLPQVFKMYCKTAVTRPVLKGDYTIVADDNKAWTASATPNVTFTKGNGSVFSVITNAFYNDGSVQLVTDNKYLVFSNGSLTLTTNGTSNSTRFYLIATGKGTYMLMSYSARKYVRYDAENQIFVADANANDADAFTFKA